MKQLMWPLIAVPPQATFSSVKKIGFACDLESDMSSTPVNEIKSLVSQFDAELYVLNSGKKDAFDPDILINSNQLESMLRPLQPNYQFITSENIDQGIIDFADRNEIDLLLILPKRHSAFSELLHESHTKQLVLHSHVPIMALHH